MKMGPVARIGLGVALLGVTGCAPPVWDRPGTTPAQFSMDAARCRLMAEGANPASGTDTISTGHFGRDLAANAAAGLVEGLVQGLAVDHTVTLCMEANGYAEHVAGAIGPAAAPAPQAVAAGPVALQLAPPSPSPMPVAALPVRPNPEPGQAHYYPPPIQVSID